MTAPDDALAAIEAHGVQSADDALAMADAILDPENDGVEWLMQHGCDVMDHLRAEVRSLRAHIAGEPDRVAAAVAAEREARIAVVERVARCEVVRDSHECVSGMAHDRLHEARALHDKATAHLDDLLSTAPPWSTVDAQWPPRGYLAEAVRCSREYLAAQEKAVQRDATNADHRALRVAKVALDAALAGCA